MIKTKANRKKKDKTGLRRIIIKLHKANLKNIRPL